MDLDDTLTVTTPEGVELSLTLAGVGSRFIAGVTDLVIQGILTVGLLVVSRALALGGLSVAIDAIGVFVVAVLYPILFEVLASGRTPGKRLSHLRVLRADGSPVDLQASAIRNLMRVLDGPPLLYLPTLVSIAITSRNQRPGDLAGATIVIREPAGPGRRVSRPRRRGLRRRRTDGGGPPVSPVSSASPLSPVSSVAGEVRWDASAVTPEELAAVRRFLERRETLDPVARRRLARRLAAGLGEKVTAEPAGLAPEPFLETLIRTKDGQ